jgi:hypothetical protein
MKLTQEERSDIAVALQVRCNYIETGTVHLSAFDVQNMGKCAPDNAEIKALSIDQMELLARMRTLIARMYAGD